MKSLSFFDSDVLSAADSRTHGARFLSVLALLIFIGWSGFELGTRLTSVRISGVISQVISEEYDCGKARNHTCRRDVIEVEYKTPSGQVAHSRLKTFGGPSSPFSGQPVDLLYNPYVLNHVFWNSLSAALIGPLCTGILAVICGMGGYGRRTSDERARAVVDSGNLAGVFESVSSSFDGILRGEGFRSGMFSLAVFSMLGKIAKVDGTVSPEELSQVEQIAASELHLEGRERQQAVDIFRAARAALETFEDFAVECRKLYGRDPGMLRMIYGLLERVAHADGSVAAAEKTLLQKASEIFFGPEQPPVNRDDPYSVLGLSPSATNAEVKVAYRRRSMELEPENLMKLGLPEGLRADAASKLLDIKNAFDKIRAERGLR